MLGVRTLAAKTPGVGSGSQNNRNNDFPTRESEKVVGAIAEKN
jgi:hypothetical protein